MEKNKSKFKEFFGEYGWILWAFFIILLFLLWVLLTFGLDSEPDIEPQKYCMEWDTSFYTLQRDNLVWDVYNFKNNQPFFYYQVDDNQTIHFWNWTGDWNKFIQGTHDAWRNDFFYDYEADNYLINFSCSRFVLLQEYEE